MGKARKKGKEEADAIMKMKGTRVKAKKDQGPEIKGTTGFLDREDEPKKKPATKPEEKKPEEKPEEKPADTKPKEEKPEKKKEAHKNRRKK